MADYNNSPFDRLRVSGDMAPGVGLYFCNYKLSVAMVGGGNEGVD
jgi:hypothetical protein